MATPNTRDDRSKASRFGLRPPRLALLSKTYTTSWDITLVPAKSGRPPSDPDSGHSDGTVSFTPRCHMDSISPICRLLRIFPSCYFYLWLVLDYERQLAGQFIWHSEFMW